MKTITITEAKAHPPRPCRLAQFVARKWAHLQPVVLEHPMRQIGNRHPQHVAGLE